MAKKKNKPEEPLEPPKVAEPLPKKPESIIVKIGPDDIRKETDDMEHIARVVNINHNTPGVTIIIKTVVYDYITKKVLKAEYNVGVQK